MRRWIVTRAGTFVEQQNNSGPMTFTARNATFSQQTPPLPAFSETEPPSNDGGRNSTLLFWQVFGFVDDEQVAFSERRPIRLGGVSPTGLLCETANNINTLAAMPEGEPPEESEENKDYDVALYPGQVVTLSGEFSLANCPWKVDVSGFHKGGDSDKNL